VKGAVIGTASLQTCWHLSNDQISDEKATKDVAVQKTDTALVHWRDVPAAVGLLTRLPVKVDLETAQKRGAKAAWAYPIVGLKIAVTLVLLTVLAKGLGLIPAITAALLLAASVIMTGAMHEDGLADTADGLWGGWDKARRLEIMKDSRTGAYGVLALILSMLLRWTCLTALLQTEVWLGGLIAVAMLSRAAMVALMTGLPNARDGGLSQSVGRPQPMTGWLAIGVATLGATLALGLTAGTLLIVAVITTSLCAGIAKTKVGGQTGDILGATQQVTEIALLITLVILAQVP
jgi:adenosylcobinamide-GDP ribazoletransferase